MCIQFFDLINRIMATKPKRTRIEDIRRLELVQAAYRVFTLHGLGGLTTARICAEAGMSPGILAYYFKGKDEVLFGMVRYSNRVLAQDVVTRLMAAKTRWQRFEAIVEGNFPAQAYDRNIANAWVSVCAAAHTNANYAKLQSIFYRRLTSNLASVFLPILDANRFGTIALATSTMIDGLWLRKAAGATITRERSVALVVQQIAAQLDAAELETLQKDTQFPQTRRKSAGRHG
jgi:TetR/AcrR family transcriptional regulator, transcriptional repressor of bet genes